MLPDSILIFEKSSTVWVNDDEACLRQQFFLYVCFIDKDAAMQFINFQFVKMFFFLYFLFQLGVDLYSGTFICSSFAKRNSHVSIN